MYFKSLEDTKSEWAGTRLKENGRWVQVSEVIHSNRILHAGQSHSFSLHVAPLNLMAQKMRLRCADHYCHHGKESCLGSATSKGLLGGLRAQIARESTDFQAARPCSWPLPFVQKDVACALHQQTKQPSLSHTPLRVREQI